MKGQSGEWVSKTASSRSRGVRSAGVEDLGQDVGVEPAQVLGDQLVLAREVLVQRPLGDLRRSAELVHAGATDALFWSMVFIGFGGRRRRGYGGGYDRGYRRGYGGGGGGCARDACLLEGGCCLAESLDGNCLLVLLLSLPEVLALLVRPVPGAGSGAQGASLAAIGRYRRDVSARRDRPVCRFTPSCSAYAEQAVRRHGAVGGAWLAVRRVVRCRPGAAGGADPVHPVRR